MAKATGDLVWKVVESDEVDIETRRDAKSPAHRTTIWIVATEDGVYIRSYKAKRGRWYQEALAWLRSTSVAVTCRREPSPKPAAG